MRPARARRLGPRRSRRHGAGTLQLLLALSLVLAFAWDFDGNPDTENLPLVVLTAPDGAVGQVAETRCGDPVARARGRLRRARRLRPVWGTSRVALWRAIAAPKRGP